MTFSKPSKSKGQSKDSYDWELLRFCNKIDTTVIGGASKLFKHFVSDYNPNSILSFADRRYSSGGLYTQLGFDSMGNTRLNYWYIDFASVKRVHRFKLRKTADDNPELTEYENRVTKGWSRIWDCGSSKWVWTNPIQTSPL